MTSMKPIIKLTLTVILFQLLINCNVNTTHSNKSNIKEVVSPPANQQAEITSYDYAIEREEKIYVYCEKSKDLPFVINGIEPSLSPDGKKLVYQERNFINQNNMKQSYIKVYIIDLITKKTEGLGDGNNSPVLEPIWSPDGENILYKTWTGRYHSTGIVNNKKNFRVLSSILPHGDNSCTWAFDSKKILIQSFDSIYFFNLNGLIIKTIPVNNLINISTIDNRTKFYLTNEEDQIIFNAGIRSQQYNPPKAIFSYNLKNKKTTMITPEGMNCSWISLLTSNNIYFIASNKTTHTTDLYEMELDGKGLKLLKEDVTNFTMATNK